MVERAEPPVPFIQSRGVKYYFCSSACRDAWLKKHDKEIRAANRAAEE
jgi:YHS domain-containing protein